MTRYTIDLTTSRNYRGVPAVGIVRTEREVASAFLRERVDARFVFFDAGNGIFRSVDRDEASLIVNETPAEAALRDTPRIPHAIEEYQPTELEAHDILVSAGLVWDSDFLATFYRRRKSVGCRMAQVIYDIIPALMPEFCVEGMFDRFPAFVLNALWCADRIYGISDNTNKDIVRYAGEIGAPLPVMDRIELGCDLRSSAAASRPPSLPGLKSGKFVLYVSTLEPRKNHMMIYQVWRKLIREHPDEIIPLVFIGHDGWNSADMIKIMSMDEALKPDNLHVVAGVDDAGLEWLYENCAFTVYPSFYEGWGLPVAESLGRGKCCIASSASSLPEAAQGCATLVDPLDFDGWFNAVYTYLSDLEALRSAEAHVKLHYKAPQWADVADKFCHNVIEWGESSARGN